MNRVFIGIGSNVGDRIANLHKACLSLAAILNDFTTSSIWETKPQIVENQPLFLNMVVSGFYEGNENQCLDDLHRIEASLGRNRSKEIPKGPRTMDLDILIFSDLSIKTERLTIPHEGLMKRAFVLFPFLEIYSQKEPGFILYKKALDQIDDQGVKCFMEMKKGFPFSGTLEGQHIE